MFHFYIMNVRRLCCVTVKQFNTLNLSRVIETILQNLDCSVHSTNNVEMHIGNRNREKLSFSFPDDDAFGIPMLILIYFVVTKLPLLILIALNYQYLLVLYNIYESVHTNPLLIV